LGCGAALAIGVLVFLAVSLLATVLFILAPGSNNASALYLHAQPGSLRWNTGERFTVLLLGVNGALHQSEPTDLMIIASFDPSANSANLLSIPGNLWVTIPGYGPSRIDQGYADGGPRLALLLVESITHVPIPYYLTVTSDGFKQIVDGLGGLTIDVRGHAAQHLNGAAALNYGQTMASRAGDTSGMWRQQELLAAIERQVQQPQSFFQIPAIVNELGGTSVDTNFPYDRVQQLARALLSLPPSRIHGAMLDRSNHAVTQYGGDQQNVLLPAWQNIRSIAQQLFGPVRLGLRGGVEVLNGAGQAGQAARLADWLRQANVSVRGYDSASSFGYAHTQVVINDPTVARAFPVAHAIAALLQAPIIERHVWKPAAPVVVIIGHDFQDPNQE
jgi:LCP family protein required for cell wall assembly